MAEVLGVVAGGAGLASLAIQLAESSVKLRRLYGSYQGAPKLLQDILEDLDTFALALRNLEMDRQQHDRNNRDIVDRCVRTCVRAVAQVEAAVTKFERAIQKSNIKGRLLTAFGQADISQLCDELERAKSSLIIAYQLYTRSCQKEDTTKILEQMNSNATLLQQISTQAVAYQLTSKRRSVTDIGRQGSPPRHTGQKAVLELVQHERSDPHWAKRKRSRRSWRICFNSWFTTHIWEISLNVAQSGFDFSLRTCNIVPADALIFEACSGGDILEVQALFKSGEASPFDCCYNYQGWSSGTTVLAAAASSGNVQLCRYLIEIAGFPISPANSTEPLSAYATTTISEEDRPEAVEMYRLFLKQPGWDVDALDTDEDKHVWWWACPNDSCMRLLRDQFALEFSTPTWASQVGLAITNIGHRRAAMPRIFLAMLGRTVVDSHIAQLCDNGGMTALHMVIRQLLWLERVPTTWVEFVRELLAHGADVHQGIKIGNSPLMWLLKKVTETYYWHPTDMIRTWVQLLKTAGRNLQDYGQCEWAAWNTLYPSGLEGSGRKIKSWTHGPCVDDWTVDWLEKRVITIFRMVDADVPGSWPISDRFRIKTICWWPERQDYDGPWRWGITQEVTLYYKRCPSSEQLDQDTCYVGLSEVLGGTQDDCRSVMCLIQTRTRGFNRPRSYSLPSTRMSRYFHLSHNWLPWWCHLCPSDGRLHFTSGPASLPNNRRCAKGDHNSEWSGDRFDYHMNIKQQMRRFQTRYRDRDELRSLPYAAYHPTWKREYSPAEDDDEFSY